MADIAVEKIGQGLCRGSRKTARYGLVARDEYGLYVVSISTCTELWDIPGCGAGSCES